MKKIYSAEEQRMAAEALACAQSALHYADHLPAGRKAAAIVARLVDTVARLTALVAEVGALLEE